MIETVENVFVVYINVISYEYVRVKNMHPYNGKQKKNHENIKQERGVHKRKRR